MAPPSFAPEERSEIVAQQGTRKDPGTRLKKIRERNAGLSGVEAIEAAREVALRQLDSRSRSRHQLQCAIESQGFSSTIAHDVLDRLERVGLIDDEAFARAIVSDRFRTSGKSGVALAEEMRRKGLDETVIEKAMSCLAQEDIRARGAELVEKKLRAMRGVSRQVAYRRLFGMLARKGYSPGMSHKIVAEALDMRDSCEEWENKWESPEEEDARCP